MDGMLSHYCYSYLFLKLLKTVILLENYTFTRFHYYFNTLILTWIYPRVFFSEINIVLNNGR